MSLTANICICMFKNEKLQWVTLYSITENTPLFFSIGLVSDMILLYNHNVETGDQMTQ